MSNPQEWETELTRKVEEIRSSLLLIVKEEKNKCQKLQEFCKLNIERRLKENNGFCPIKESEIDVLVSLEPSVVTYVYAGNELSDLLLANAALVAYKHSNRFVNFKLPFEEIERKKDVYGVSTAPAMLFHSNGRYISFCVPQMSVCQSVQEIERVIEEYLLRDSSS